MAEKKENRYSQILALVFESGFTPGATRVQFERTDLEHAADAIGIKLPKNLGDVIYSFRFRNKLPDSIIASAPEGYEWIIRGTGRAKYAFVAVPNQVRILPREGLITIKIPDATPEIIRSSALGDEQALLALVRYNRLLDIFLGITTYSLQNHLRTTVQGIGQVEVDEVYVGLDRYGVQYVMPVQAKGGSDEIGLTQIEQDFGVCAQKWPHMTARSVAVQFMDDDKIAMFELGLQDDQVAVIREAHYRLVAFADITDEDRDLYLRARDV
ncbi:endonuclease [Microbacterium sp. NPDC091676]|uniref:endonuclease n=1 Tax=Microbacterium sp. NPDC091676 TaxID=3364212 RepID=UPI00382F3730